MKSTINTDKDQRFYIVNSNKFDKKSMYGRITAVGEINMKHDTFEKAVKAITCSLLLFSMAAQADLSMAFGGGPVEGDKVVTVYDGDQKKVITTRTNSFKKY